MPRRNQHMQELLPEIKEMLSQGMTQKQVEDKLGLTGYRNYGEYLHRYPNLLNRDFHADCPNQKWVTDTSYIKTGTKQNVNLVLSTTRAAKRKEKVTAELQFHSDQGFQYTSQAYFMLTQSYHITPSMSRRENPYDNALAENFFSSSKPNAFIAPKSAAMRRRNSS